MTARKDRGSSARALWIGGGAVAAAAACAALWIGLGGPAPSPAPRVPDPQAAETPATATTAAPAPEVALPPEPVATATPEPEVAAAPDPAATAAPDPAATAVPEAEATAAPEPEVAAAPDSEVAAAPDPEVTATPEPVATAAPEAEVAAAPDSEVAAAPEPEVAAAPAPTPDAAADPVAESAPAVSDPGPAAAEPVLPGFDVVRVSPEGDAVIAGQADPRSDVVIRVDGVQAASTTADAQGKFVSLFTLPPSAVPRIVTLQSVLADGRRLTSAESVILVPTPQPPPVALADAAEPAAAAADPAAATADPAAERAAAEVVAAPAADSAAEAVAAADPVVSAPAPATAQSSSAAPEPAPQAALLLSEGGARVLQAAGGGDIDPRNVTIDAISYSTKGEVQLSGRGQAQGFVRLYLDNEPLMDTGIAPDGTWEGTLPAVAAGKYLLRADQLDAQGAVLSRYETPFQRESPEVLAAAAPDGADAQMAAKITVQPGFTLWGIARQNYGSGVLYVQVYEANKQMIGDPDLIYPGQVFNVPVRTPGP